MGLLLTLKQSEEGNKEQTVRREGKRKKKDGGVHGMARMKGGKRGERACVRLLSLVRLPVSPAVKLFTRLALSMVWERQTTTTGDPVVLHCEEE